MTVAFLSTGTLIVGIDEAGRGALAGPVVAAACILPTRSMYPVCIGDSKQMTENQRDESYEWLTSECMVGTGSVDASEIDRIGILAATEIAMQRAVGVIAKKQRDLYLLVDGRDAFWFDHPHSSIIRGDSSERCIGAASIIAKVTRDRHMIALDSEYPEYGFMAHKGYGAPEHCRAIARFGLLPLHRRYFCKNLQVFSDALAPTPALRRHPSPRCSSEPGGGIEGGGGQKIDRHRKTL